MVYIVGQDLIAAGVGGIIIAIATSIVLLTYGRICGLSGIFGTVLKFSRGSDFDWKASFFAGFILLPVIFQQVFGESFPLGPNIRVPIVDPESIVQSHNDLTAWLLGGFLVGVGTKMGNGCTSGHGVCGLPRFSVRSIAAVCTFMATGIIMAVIKGT